MIYVVQGPAGPEWVDENGRPIADDATHQEDTCGSCGATVNAHTGRCPWYCNADRAGAIGLPRRKA